MTHTSIIHGHPYTKKEAVNTDENLASIAATPRNHAEQRGHRQKPQRTPLKPYYI